MRELGRILERGTCRYCHRPVVWGLLPSGFHRAFQPELFAANDVAERDRYAVHKRMRAVVNLDGDTNPPPKVLVAHHCAEYAEAVRMRGISSIGDGMEELLTRWAGAA